MDKDLINELRATFKYHPDGYLIRKSTGAPCGQVANRRDGYAAVGVNGRMLRAHRIIYAINHGRMPKGEIDHIDQNPMNNRIENLRDVSRAENEHNSKKRKNNASGFTGIYWNTRHRKWWVEIMADNQRIYLGLFEDFDDAVLARKMAKIKYHPTSPEALRFARELFPCGA